MAIWTAVPAAVLLAGLALRRDLLGELPTAVRMLWAAPALATVAASAAVAVRQVLAASRRRTPRPAQRRALLVASHAVVLLAGLYVGQRLVGDAGRDAVLPSALAHLERDQVESLLTEDLARLRTVVALRYALPAWTPEAKRAHKTCDVALAAAEAVHVAGWTRAEVRGTLGIRASVMEEDPLAALGGEPWRPWPPERAAELFLIELRRLA